MARERLPKDQIRTLKIRFLSERKNIQKQYNTSTSDEVDALVLGDIGDNTIPKRDIIIKDKVKGLQQILNYTLLIWRHNTH